MESGLYTKNSFLSTLCVIMLQIQFGVSMPIARVERAIEEIKNGNMVVMMDDEDRENEGDLVYASTFTTPEKVNFMASIAKGLICVSITKEDAIRLDLKPMVEKNSSSHETAFTVSVDAKGCATGISAYERDDTIRLLADPTTVPSDLVRPGHIFPLIAKDGGTLVRTGHTEGSIDLCKLAGLYPSGVICEIMKDDGTMARRNDLEEFAQKYDLHIVFVSDIVEYRLKKESLVKTSEARKVDFFGKTAELRVFQDHFGKTHQAYIFGHLSENANVKFHNVSPDIEMLTNYHKFQSLQKSVEYIQNNGGVFILLGATDPHENGEFKEIGIGAQILTVLGIKSINLLTSSAHKEFVGIAGFGLSIVNKLII
jgi:3,4-dihydroxy 2-butanone 4-phosphate synthase/GTP cyclohydrolase II